MLNDLKFWQLLDVILSLWGIFSCVLILRLLVRFRGYLPVDIPSGMTLDTTQHIWVNGRLFYSEQEYNDSMGRVEERERAKGLYYRAVLNPGEVWDPERNPTLSN